VFKFLIDNIFVVFGNQFFQQTVGMSMGTNCAPLLADLYLYSYEAELVQNSDKPLVLALNLIQHLDTCIDDVCNMQKCDC
jgi:hypothetical protein